MKVALSTFNAQKAIDELNREIAAIKQGSLVRSILVTVRDALMAANHDPDIGGKLEKAISEHEKRGCRA